MAVHSWVMAGVHVVQGLPLNWLLLVILARSSSLSNSALQGVRRLSKKYTSFYACFQLTFGDDHQMMMILRVGFRVGHDQVFSLYAPIPIFQKNKCPDPIINQIFDKNSDQIPIIDPIKNSAIYQKKTIFCK
jgi:hypothetical protein